MTRMRWNYQYVDAAYRARERNSAKLTIQVAIANLPERDRVNAKEWGYGYKLPIGRGYRGLNLFCCHECVLAYLRKLTPKMETKV